MVEQRSRVRIAVVDDDSVIASTLSLILQQRGFSATAFFDARSALKSAKENSPDLVISDVGMPDMNGVELALQLRQEIPSCKIMLISGAIETEKIIEAHRKQGNHFTVLYKPVPPERLLQYVYRLTPHEPEP